MSQPGYKKAPAGKQKKVTSNPGKMEKRNRTLRNWTAIEISGLALSFFLIVWPILTIAVSVSFPHQTNAAFDPPTIGTPTIGSNTTSVTTGDAITISLSVSSFTNDPVNNPTRVYITFPIPAEFSSCSASTPDSSGNASSDSSNAIGIWNILSQVSVPVTLNINCLVVGSVTTTINISGMAWAENNSLSPTGYISTGSIQVNITGVTIPPTSTPTSTPTNTPVSTPTSTPVNTSVSSPTNVATNTPVQTPVFTPTPKPSTTFKVTTVVGTPTPLITQVPTALITNQITPNFTPNDSGVVAGSITNKAVSLAGAPIYLVWRKPVGEQIINSSVVDSSGQFYFGGVGATGAGETYYIRFTSSDSDALTLRSFTSTNFSFLPGSITRVDGIDLSDISIQSPGSGQVISLPFNFSWTGRGEGESFALFFYDSNGKYVFQSGDLGSATSYNLPTGSLEAGRYTAQVILTAANGNGLSGKRFDFEIGSAVNTVNLTNHANQLLPTLTQSQVKNETPVTENNGLSTNLTPNPYQVISTSAGTTATAANETKEPTSSVSINEVATIGVTTSLVGAIIGNGQLSTSTATATKLAQQTTGSSGNNSSNGNGNALPKSGGELPVLGLFLAALTISGRRLRIFKQSR